MSGDTSAAERLQHVENMRVRQSRVAHGDHRWYVTTANGFPTGEGYDERHQAEAQLAMLRRWTEQEIDKEQEAEWDRSEHLAEARAVEAHQEEKHGDY